MLILARYTNESIVIGDDIIITITSVKGGQVQVGIDAPKHLSIVRDELIPRDRDSKNAARPEAVKASACGHPLQQ